MLKELLRLVAQGSMHTRAELARELEVSGGWWSRCWRIWRG